MMPSLCTGECHICYEIKKCNKCKYGHYECNECRSKMNTNKCIHCSPLSNNLHNEVITFSRIIELLRTIYNTVGLLSVIYMYIILIICSTGIIFLKILYFRNQLLINERITIISFVLGIMILLFLYYF